MRLIEEGLRFDGWALFISVSEDEEVADEVQIPSEGISSEEVSSAKYLYSGLFQIDPSAVKYFVITMAAAAMKHMASSFVKLEKFEGVDFRRWQKKMHFMLSSMSVVNVDTFKELWDTLEAKYMAEDASSKKFLVSNFTNYKITDSRPILEQFNKLLGILGRFTQHNMNMDESIKELTLVELGSHLRSEESLIAHDNNKPKGNNVGPSVVNMVEHNNSSRYNDHKGKCKNHDTRANPNKKLKVTCRKCRKLRHLKKDCKGCNIGNIANGSSTKGPEDDFFVHDDDVARWVDSGATVHVCKDRCWFKTYESLNDGSILYMGNESTALVHRRGCVDLSDLCDLQATPSLGNKKYFVIFIDDASRVPNKRNKIIPYEPWTKRKLNLDYLRVWGCRAVIRLPNPKLKNLGKRGIKCIFVGYAEHSKTYRFYVIEPYDSVAINSIIESMDAIFDENRKSKRQRTPKDFGPEFQLYLIEKTRDEISDQHSYCFNVEDDPKTFDEAMKSQDVAYWKEAINDEMESIIGNNTWVLTDLPPGCRPLECKWIFKRKLKVDGTVEKFKARLVIQGFNQKSGIDYFDNYAHMARISTIRLLIAMALIHNLIIHQMDVKKAFLNGDLEEEVYMKQPLGCIMPGNENKVCKLIKSLYGLKQSPKQWHQNFDEVVLSNGYLLNQADKCVYSKFDASSKGVIICLYVDDMLIFGTNQVQVDLTKEFLSSGFSMKDIKEAYVILGIRIKHESNGIAISQSYYIEKVLKKFNYSDYTPVSTPLDTCKKLMPNKGLAASKKKTCIIGSIMEYEFMALVAAGKEAEWLKKLFLEIPLWVKPIPHISIRCDSAATLAKAYSQIYNGKSRHLGVRYNMIRELIMNRIVSIEFDTQLPAEKTWQLSSMWKAEHSEAHVLQIYPKDVLGTCCKEDEVSDFSMIEPSVGMLHSELADDSGL
uniref:Zinc finger, CCHC-type n=1 Tax=Tanacetum cinerariifolium TaxID=118510 RepID=A0A699GW45_TANCI|nr:zinc finger, CCHC-type [Tanacetum cinerariifolium]